MDIIQQLLKLIKINTRISSLHSSDEILKEIMNEAMSLTGTAAAFILQVSANRELVCLARYHCGELEPGMKWSSSSALKAHDAQRMVYSTRALESSTAPSIVMGSIQTLISSPLSVEPSGTIILQLVGRDITSIDPQTISLLNLFVSQVQVTISKSELEESAVRNATMAATGTLAAQLAHDIRSPLAALASVLAELKEVPEDKRLIVRSAVCRIQDIANNLIERHRESGGAGDAHPAAPKAGETAPARLLWSLIDPLITEKRLQFRSKIGIDINVSMDASSCGLFAVVQPAEFQRTLSNLIDNAVEAIKGKGSVMVELACEEDNVLLRVKDDGAGITSEILPNLGIQGATFGKPGGTGLGLFHAKISLESWGGVLQIASQPGEGTTVSLRIPRAQPPAWFVAKLELKPGHPIVVLDDDSSIHRVWRGRLASLPVKGKRIEVLHFSSPTELREWVRGNLKASKKALYLADYELAGHPETGLTLIEELGLGDLAILVTSHFEEKEVLAECLRLNVRMIPKGLAGFVPIEIDAAHGPSGSPRPRTHGPDAVLIDDDALVHMTWRMAAKSKGLALVAYRTSNEFLAALEGLPKDTPVYLDSKLGDGVQGAHIAKDLHAQGFSNLYLATGQAPEFFPQMPWIKKIVGKEPPWP